MTVEQLAWDSEFFGVRIARASPDTPLAAIAEDARQQGVACVYIETENALSAAPEGTELVHTDRRVRLRVVENHADVNDQPAPKVRPGTVDDLPRLARAIDAVAPWSRFAHDPRFGLGAARRMYEAWLARAAQSPQELLGVVDQDGSPFAFITATEQTPPEIGLIAAAAPNSGAGTSLIRWAKAETRSYGPLEVVTQATNERALSLYKREGFEVCARSNAYHLWIDSKGAEA